MDGDWKFEMMITFVSLFLHQRRKHMVQAVGATTWRIRCYRNWRWRRRMFIDFLSFLLFHFVMALATLHSLGLRSPFFFPLFSLHLADDGSTFFFCLFSLPKWRPFYPNFIYKQNRPLKSSQTIRNRIIIRLDLPADRLMRDSTLLIAWRPRRPSCPFQCKWQVHRWRKIDKRFNCNVLKGFPWLFQ